MSDPKDDLEAVRPVVDERTLEDSNNRDCLTPGTHDKLAEAHHFIHQMVENYHEPGPFRYSLSAFLQAARNVTFILQSELSGALGFKEYWTENQQAMRNDADLKLLNDSRITVVHKSSLVPASSMFIGHFKYGKAKIWFPKYAP